MSVALGFAPRSMPARLAIRSDYRPRLLVCSRAPTCIQMRASIRRWAGSRINDNSGGQLLACTWLTTTPERITPDAILSRCPTPEPDFEPDHIPILLITPALARWVDTNSTFLEQWMNQLYHRDPNYTSDRPVHAVVAVVDRLPDQCARNGGKILDRSITEAEGISTLLAKGENVLGRAVALREFRSVENEEPTLVFSFQKDNRHASNEATCQPPHEVGLRLANTIFVNGKENTLFGTRWAYNPTLKRLSLEKLVDLERCSVTIAPRNIHSSLELPLHPVGERRKVISSMGNILRQIAKNTDAKSNEPMPASSELERELPRYIDEHNITDRRVSVWALIETSAESLIASSRHSQISLAKSIQLGAKLHRVMSGGGGWGKKQGLLSLDPETGFQKTGSERLLPLHRIFSPNSERRTQEDTSPFEQVTSVEDLSTLSQAAEPGDYVQFFASVEQDQTQKDHDAAVAPEGRLSCCFGVVSDADILLSETAQQTDLKIIQNHFGALSEKAITYLQPAVGTRSNDMVESQTKIDVPGSRVDLVLK